MKLLYCPDCGDIFNLTKKDKICSCGKTKGKYLNNLNATYSGGIPLGFDNYSFLYALKNQPENGTGRNFEAFVIPKNCVTMEKK